MAEVKVMGLDALNQIVKEVPVLIQGDNIILTPDATEPNKITISATGGEIKSIPLTGEGNTIEALFKETP